MASKLIVTEHADMLLDNLVYHLIHRLKNQQAAKHFLSELENIYDRLEDNPQQFPLSRDSYLANKGYHEAIIPQMNYVLIFSIDADVVEIVRIFHQLKDYQTKL